MLSRPRLAFHSARSEAPARAGLAPDRRRATLAIAAAIIALAMPSAWGQIGAIVLGGALARAHRLGLFLHADSSIFDHPFGLNRRPLDAAVKA
jgi:hypothetical protein